MRGSPLCSNSSPQHRIQHRDEPSEHPRQALHRRGVASLRRARSSVSASKPGSSAKPSPPMPPASDPERGPTGTSTIPGLARGDRAVHRPARGPAVPRQAASPSTGPRPRSPRQRPPPLQRHCTVGRDRSKPSCRIGHYGCAPRPGGGLLAWAGFRASNRVRDECATKEPSVSMCWCSACSVSR